MSKQLHKNFTDEQVKLLLKSYVDKEIKIDYILQMLKIKRDPDNFSIQYERKTINRKIDPDIEKNIVKELKIEKDLIKAKDVPIKYKYYPRTKDRKRFNQSKRSTD
jgi:hypothetical protein